MRSIGTPTTEAGLSVEQPPRSFSAFDLTPIPPEPGEQTGNLACFNVRCKSCGGDDFHFGCFPITAPDPSPYREIAPGETFRRPPHRLKCANCGKTEPIFDVRTDGYDGILCGGGPYESGETGEAFTDVANKIAVAATYNIQLWELEELAATVSGVKATDLFDWFNIELAPLDGSEVTELDYECA